MTNNKQLRERLRQTTLAIGIKLGYLNPNDLDSQLKGKMYTELENINNILVDLLDSVREESDEEVRKQVLRARKAERKLEEYKGMIEGLKQPQQPNYEANLMADKINIEIDEVLKKL